LIKAGPFLDNEPIWCAQESGCALEDSERHLGHIIKTNEGWHAYDATHLNLQEDGIRELGCFADLAAAKTAVETSIARHGRESLRMAC
jgi:hypothetical protein